MAMTEEQYLAQLQTLLPTGPAWTREPDANLTKALFAISVEFARIDAAVERLVEESDVRSADELLTDWERVLGLYAGDQTQAQRRAALLGQLNTLGGQSEAYYIGVAATLGYAITITYFAEHTVDDDVDCYLFDAAWAFVWQVHAASVAATDTQFENIIKRIAPAHTTVLFSYA